MNIQEYRQWCTEQVSPEDGITVYEETDRIHYQCEWAEGQMIFYDEDIVELIILQDEQNVFYLHFQLHDDEHAITLFFEMKNYLLSLKDKKTYHILLTCTSAFTTGYFAGELNKVAELMKLDMDFKAIPFPELYSVAANYDMVLLSPQEAYEYDNVKAALQDQIVLKIPSAIFARFSTGELITIIQEERKKAQTPLPEEALPIDLNTLVNNDYRILTLGLINHRGLFRLGYRIYDHGKPTLDKEVIKPTFTDQDLYDLLDYIVARHNNIDAIGIAIAGIAFHGVLNQPALGFNNVNIGKELHDKYGIPTIVMNDINAVALGYHVTHEDTDDMVFYFQPIGWYSAGAGVILDGKLRTGHKHLAGEMLFALAPHYTDTSVQEHHTSEKTLEVLTAGMRDYIATIAPRKIFYNCWEMPNEQMVREKLMEIVSEEYMPEIKHVFHIKKYMLPGVLVHCLEWFQDYKLHPERYDYWGHENE